MSAAFVASADELHGVPDGTVISWLRIPGDHTSEAVAFVRREVEYDDEGTAEVVIWVSPGGWNPLTVEQAGVTFPATVIRWGEVAVSEQPMISNTLLSGGTWPRETALHAAVELFKHDTLYVLPRNGEGPLLGPVFDVADEFVRWLTRDEIAEALNATISAGVITDEQARGAYLAWHDRDRAADGDPTSIINAERGE